MHYYAVSIFEEIDDDPDEPPHPDQITVLGRRTRPDYDPVDTDPSQPESVILVPLDRVRVLANSERWAAARAWVQTLGRARAKVLASFNVPSFVIDEELHVEKVVPRLETASTSAGTAWKLIGPYYTATWHFKVETLNVAS